MHIPPRPHRLIFALASMLVATMVVGTQFALADRYATRAGLEAAAAHAPALAVHVSGTLDA